MRCKVEKMMECPKCGGGMVPEGETSNDGVILFYHCPKCKNIKLRARRFATRYRLAYL
ncbi:MAG: hypothetical protein ACM3UY_03595 [Methanocella sp.]